MPLMSVFVLHKFTELCEWILLTCSIIMTTVYQPLSFVGYYFKELCN